MQCAGGIGIMFYSDNTIDAAPANVRAIDSVSGSRGCAVGTSRVAPVASRGLLPVRRRGDHLGWSTPGVGSAAAFESADRPDGHVLVAEYLARQTHAGQAPSLKPRFSAVVIFVGSPSMNSTRQVVHRALPPQACKTSTLASCSIASTSLLPSGTSKVPYPSTVSLDIPTLYGMTDERTPARRAGQRGRGLARGRGVPLAGELLSGVHQPTLPVTAST